MWLDALEHSLASLPRCGQLNSSPKLPDFAFFCLSFAAFNLRPVKGRLSSQPNSTAAAFSVGNSPPSSCASSSPTSTSESSACIGSAYCITPWNRRLLQQRHDSTSTCVVCNLSERSAGGSGTSRPCSYSLVSVTAVTRLYYGYRNTTLHVYMARSVAPISVSLPVLLVHGTLCMQL